MVLLHLISFFLVSLFVTFGAVYAAASTTSEWETKYPMLGTNNLVEVLNVSYDVTVDEDCNYHFTVNFTHNTDLPIGSAESCVPEAVADFDGLPMLVGRAYYDLFPSYVEDATGFNHLSLDYNPCGHPSGGFLSPHYDMHFYLVSLEYRAEEMVCVTIPGIPVCAPEQNTSQGIAFFNVEQVDPSTIGTAVSRGSVNTTDDNTTSVVFLNMPEGFTAAPADAIIHMGMHSFDRDFMPATPQDWTEPTIVFGSHYEVVFFEPMLPLHFVMGDENHSSQKDIEYVAQTITTLPVNFESKFDATAKVTTIYFSGKSNVCKTTFDEAKTAYYEASSSSSTTDSDTDQQSSDGALFVSSIFGYSVVAAITSILFILAA